MDRCEFEHYLHEHIPLSHAMGIEVVEASWGGVTLQAPLAPNINHRETLFSGSASAVAILAAWALLYIRLQQGTAEKCGQRSSDCSEGSTYPTEV